MFLRSDQADCEVGLRYSTDGMQVTLCEASCLKVNADAAGLLEFMFECESLP